MDSAPCHSLCCLPQAWSARPGSGRHAFIFKSIDTGKVPKLIELGWSHPSHQTRVLWYQGTSCSFRSLTLSCMYLWEVVGVPKEKFHLVGKHFVHLFSLTPQFVGIMATSVDPSKWLATLMMQRTQYKHNVNNAVLLFFGSRCLCATTENHFIAVQPMPKPHLHDSRKFQGYLGNPGKSDKTCNSVVHNPTEQLLWGDQLEVSMRRRCCSCHWFLPPAKKASVFPWNICYISLVVFPIWQGWWLANKCMIHKTQTISNSKPDVQFSNQIHNQSKLQADNCAVICFLWKA